MPFLNPFKRYDISHFKEHVWVPLESAPPRHPAVTAANECRRAQVANSERNTSNDTAASTVEKGATTTDQAASTQHRNAEKPTGTTTEMFSIASLKEEVEADIQANGHDSVYDRKCTVLNKALADINMGSYQWYMFCLCGAGWLADNLWLQGVALTIPSFTAEYGVSSTEVRFTTLALFLGLIFGASFWGTVSDIVGRRPAFSFTLLITAIFGTAVGGTKTWLAACGLYAALGCGVGGNLPVDGSLFLEFLPHANGNLLTLLSVWWPCGQLLASVAAWGFLANFSCVDASGASLPTCGSGPMGGACCTTSSNMGWRYLNYTMGAFTFVMFTLRFFCFHLFESPKFLLSKGRQSEAVASVYGIAYANGVKTWLSEDILNEIGGSGSTGSQEVATSTPKPPSHALTTKQILTRTLSRFSSARIRPLFATKRLGFNTALLFFIWLAIGLGYPLFNAFLPQYLAQTTGASDPTASSTKPVAILYRNYAITSIVGCPGSLIAYFTVDIPYVGRKGTMATATLLTGIFLFLFTQSTADKYQLAFSCAVAFFQNVMYGVLYAYTPETFPAPNRGTGTGICSCLNRLAGLAAPLVGVYAAAAEGGMGGGSSNAKVPIYVSGALMLAAWVAMCGLPIETRGRAVL